MKPSHYALTLSKKLSITISNNFLNYSTSSTLDFPTTTLSFVPEKPLLRRVPVVAAADMKRSCTACLVDGCWRSAHRLFTIDPTRPALLHITLKSFYSLHTNGNNNPFLSIWWLSAPHLVSTTRHSNPKKVNSITHTPIQVNRTPIYIISNLHQNLVLSI